MWWFFWRQSHEEENRGKEEERVSLSLALSAASQVEEAFSLPSVCVDGRWQRGRSRHQRQKQECL